MKKFLLSILLLSAGLSSTAQEPQPKKNILGFEPIILVRSSLEINYERYFTHNLSGKLLSQIVYETDGPAYTRGVVEDIALKVYGMREKDIIGVGLSAYFMPYLHYSNFDIMSYRSISVPGDYNYSLSPFHRTFQGFGGGVLVGMSITLSGKVVLDAYFGGGLQANDAPFNPYFDDGGSYGYDRWGESSTFWERKGIVPKGGIEIGFKL